MDEAVLPVHVPVVQPQGSPQSKMWLFMTLICDAEEPGRRFLRIFVGWGLTLVIAGLVSPAAIASWGVYTPNKSASDAAVFTANVRPILL